VTETEWLACRDPRPMLRFLRSGASGVIGSRLARLAGRRGVATPRKLRLFALACGRRVGLAEADVPTDPQTAADAAVRAAVDDAVQQAGEAAWEDETRYATDWDPITAGRADSAARYAEGEVDRAAVGADEAEAQADLLREIFGDPTAPTAFDPAWRTGAAVALARAAYEEPTPGGELDPFRMALLADALEEAGCTDERVVRHCRGFERCLRCGGTGRSAYDWGYAPPPTEPCPECGGTGWSAARAPHVRGCWVVDLVLGEG
jgi:hypothetical protein